MTLYFQNSKGQERVIAENLKTRKDAYKAMNEFLDQHKFVSYYVREIFKEDCITLDVGSHTEFFHLKGTKEEIEACHKDVFEKS